MSQAPSSPKSSTSPQRTRTKRTRARFAERFGLDMRTVEQREQGRRKPDRSTETYLRLIDKAPDTVAELVARL